MAIATDDFSMARDDSGPARKRPKRNRPRKPAADTAVARERVRYMTRRIAQLILLLLSCAALWWGGQWLWRHVRNSPAFAISTIELQGNQRLDSHDVLAAAQLRQGDNIFEHPSESVAARIKRHPWIADVHVKRNLPGQIKIEVREHQPAAILVLDGLYLVADDGAVFKQVDVGDPVDLPVVTGASQERFQNERQYRASLLLKVLALFEEYRAAGLWRREPLAEVNIDAQDELAIYIGDDATYVRLGDGPYATKLRRLRRILDRLEGRHMRAEYVLLDNVHRPDRATVKLR